MVIRMRLLAFCYQWFTYLLFTYSKTCFQNINEYKLAAHSSNKWRRGGWGSGIFAIIKPLGGYMHYVGYYWISTFIDPRSSKLSFDLTSASISSLWTTMSADFRNDLLLLNMSFSYFLFLNDLFEKFDKNNRRRGRISKIQ